MKGVGGGKGRNIKEHKQVMNENIWKMENIVTAQEIVANGRNLEDLYLTTTKTTQVNQQTQTYRCKERMKKRSQQRKDGLNILTICQNDHLHKKYWT